MGFLVQSSPSLGPTPACWKVVGSTSRQSLISYSVGPFCCAIWVRWPTVGRKSVAWCNTFLFCLSFSSAATFYWIIIWTSILDMSSTIYIQKTGRNYVLTPGLSDVEVFCVIKAISHGRNTTISFYDNITTRSSLTITLLLCLVQHPLSPKHAFLS